MRFVFLATLAALCGAAPSSPPFVFNEMTESQKRAIDKATTWLLQAQNPDGSWGLDGKSDGDVTCTALAGLALMADGRMPSKGRKTEALHRATAWLMEKARRPDEDGLTGHGTKVQRKLGKLSPGFFATAYLSQVYAVRPGWADDHPVDMRAVLGKQAEMITQYQEPDGSWSRRSFGGLSGTCMAWLALRASSSAGIEFREDAVDRIRKLVKSKYNPGTKLFDRGDPVGDYQSLYATASAVRILHGMGDSRSMEASNGVDALVKYVQEGKLARQFLTVEGEDYLSSVLVTQALILGTDSRWPAWFRYIRDQLMSRQNDDGSWSTTACITGRTFPTTCSLLTLQAPYRFLPLQGL